ncbi:RES family NAD+ phosphorylase [Brenneria corticis]|uniref:RES domain-containing protein n=1 Tax=Brenneria corticis TaxID=2173106 RepID=A0A2U1U4Y3_9GAMM|nr:RES family NAD+ phosphorylase [Brenneria sp. CFCC 11842]PWC16715.1 hypothetical protein DDT56_08195 [Brenneria sp. CFCC 11842]
MTVELPVFHVRASELLQHVSRIVYRGDALYYGRDAINRYDDPARVYGMLYLGQDLPTALMESVFHKHQWSKAPVRSITLAEVQNRLVRAVGVLDDLRLADLTASGVMAGYFGMNLEQLSCRDYSYTQQASSRIYAMKDADGMPLFDGILYPSRNNYPGTSIALFERAGKKVGVIDDIDLTEHVEWPGFVARYGIGISD